MGLPASIFDGLLEFWPFDDDAGAVAVGYRGNHDLALARSRCNGGGVALPAAGGWTNETGGRITYNGGGLLDITGLGLLAATADAITVAVRFWPGGGQIQGGDWPGANLFQFWGMGGNYTDDNSASSGFRVDEVALNNPSQAIYLSGVAGSPTTSLAGWTYPKVASPYTPHLAIFTLTRGASDMSLTFWVDGTQKTGTITFSNTLPDLTRLMLGSRYWSTSSTTQAALWDRALTGAEILALGDNLDGLADLIDAGGLIGLDGNPSVHFAYPVPRTHAPTVLATTGPQRHTRRVHERALRRYDLRMTLAPGAEVEIVAGVIRSTRGGMLPILWRHPIDDPAAPADAVRYRLLNAAEAGVQITRAKGGATAELVLVLEEWEP